MDKNIKKIIDSALKEDFAQKDITSQKLFDPKQKIRAEIIAKTAGILCGIEIAEEIFKMVDPKCKIKINAHDGERISPDQILLTVQGRVIKILSCERIVLNFLQHLSGVASLTGKFVHAVKSTKAKIYDTRKTIPGLRFLQKYAVRCGGGNNHRMNLNEMAMVKDNHLKALQLQIEDCRLYDLKSKLPKGTKLVIETENMEQTQLALDSKADIIMLDNMSIQQLKKAIRFIRSSSPKTLIEVSGGITLQNVRQIAKLNIDRISIGALTHSAPALDISMELTGNLTDA